MRRAPACDAFHDRADLPVREQQRIATGQNQLAKLCFAEQPIDIIQTLL